MFCVCVRGARSGCDIFPFLFALPGVWRGRPRGGGYGGPVRRERRQDVFLQTVGLLLMPVLPLIPLRIFSDCVAETGGRGVTSRAGHLRSSHHTISVAQLFLGRGAHQDRPVDSETYIYMLYKNNFRRDFYVLYCVSLVSLIVTFLIVVISIMPELVLVDPLRGCRE